MRIIWATVLVGAFALAQDPAKLEFEVASVKPAAPPGGRGGLIGMRGGPGTNDPTRLQYNGMPLKMLVVNAYDVKPYQVNAPGWMGSFDARFDVVAKIPEGATKEQVRVMLQNLLADRFKLKIHRETKELPLYELTVAKNGPKLTAAVEDPNASKSGEGPPPAPLVPGKDGFPQMPKGRKGAFVAMRPGGGVRLQGTMQTMADFTNLLGQNLGSPVIDKTGLSGAYDFSLEYGLDPGQSPVAGLPLPSPPPGSGGIAAGTGGIGVGPGAGGAGPGGAGPSPQTLTPQNDLPNLFTAIQ